MCCLFWITELLSAHCTSKLTSDSEAEKVQGRKKLKVPLEPQPETITTEDGCVNTSLECRPAEALRAGPSGLGQLGSNPSSTGNSLAELSGPRFSTKWS